MKALTDTQRGILHALKQHGSWYPGIGWLWDTRSATVRNLDALVKKGFATVDRDHPTYGTIYKPVTT